MPMLKKLIASCVMFVIASSGFAAAPASSSELSALLGNIKTMQADFTQTILDNHGKAVQRSQGRLVLERPGKFRWDAVRPVRQLIISNGSTLWIYDPELEQVTIRTLTKEAGEVPALLLSRSDTVIEKQFTIKSITKNSGQKSFVLVPRNANSSFAAIQLGFSNNQLRQMQLEDRLGHTTVIQFNRIVLNRSVAASAFIFKAPRGVDVINERR